jgi:hypothetical protein
MTGYEYQQKVNCKCKRAFVVRDNKCQYCLDEQDEWRDCEDCGIKLNEDNSDFDISGDRCNACFKKMLRSEK